LQPAVVLTATPFSNDTSRKQNLLLTELTRFSGRFVQTLSLLALPENAGSMPRFFASSWFSLITMLLLCSISAED
jgi:hypothetical protein